MSESVLPSNVPGRIGKKITAILALLFGAILFYAAAVYRAECEDHAQKGFPVEHATNCSISLYRALQLFHFHDAEWPEPDSIGSHIVRYAAALYTMSVPYIVLGWIFQGTLRRWRHQLFGKGFFVVAGDHTGARQLVEDFSRKKKSVVWVKKHSSVGDEELKALVIVGNLDDPDFWLKQCYIHRSKAVVVLAGDDSYNIKISLTIESALQQICRSLVSPLKCHIHLGDIHLKKGLIQILPSDRDGQVMRRSYFSRYEIMSRLLLRKRSLPPEIIMNSDFGRHYIIIGFETLGQNVALKIAKMGRQVVLKNGPEGPIFETYLPRITIVHERGETTVDSFLKSYPGFQDTCKLSILTSKYKERGFLNNLFSAAIREQSNATIIYCTDDEASTVSSVLMVLDELTAFPKIVDTIYCYAPDQEGISSLLLSEQNRLGSDTPVSVYATDAEVFTEDIILNQSLDLIAERIHSEYSKNTRPEPNNPTPIARKSWSELTEEERNDSREPADHLWAKLNMLGFSLRVSPLQPRRSKFQDKEALEMVKRQIESMMEVLARSEHYRWMACKLINGWSYGPKRDNFKKKHPDITEYENLSESGKEKDRLIVRIVPELIEDQMLSLSVTQQ